VGDAFGGMSAEGRRLMTEAHLAGFDPGARAGVERARERTLGVLAADPLDEMALKAALDEEAGLVRRSADARRDRLFDAYRKLSPADRKAYVAASRGGGTDGPRR
jgi:hypothetical protein